MTLLDVAARARAQDRDIDLDLFLSVAPSSDALLAMLLAVAIEVNDEDLESIARDVWSDHGTDWLETLQSLARWPFVMQSSAGWSIDPRMADPLSREFQDSQPIAFQKAHESLAQLEEQKEALANPHEEWFIRGRVAFYLAGIDAQRSASAFRSGFADAPMLERSVARLWLARLVDRQERLLGPESRTVAFFRGFRFYVTGRREEAAEEFQHVIDTGVSDEFLAIAMHLWAVIKGSPSGSDGRRLLESAVNLSDRLGLTDNAVMARHTLSWSLVIEAQEGADHDVEASKPLLRASTIAQQNRDLALGSEDPALISWTRRTAASIEWLTARAFLQADASTADRLVEELLVVRDLSLETFEMENATYASNDAAGILRDQQRYADATEIIESAIQIAEWTGGVPAGALNKLGQTTGSMFTLTRDRQTTDRLQAAIDKINRLMNR